MEKKSTKFKLVEGQYTPLEAKKNSIRFNKINFHQLENFSNEIRFARCRSFKIRIELLTMQKT
jgi:hypothetical protein